MSYKFQYCQEVSRVIPAVIIDARADIPSIANKIGVIIKKYTDSQVALVTKNVIMYCVESREGNLAGYFTLEVNPETKGVSLQQLVVRPAFGQFLPQISGEINIFIRNNQWQADFLF